MKKMFAALASTLLVTTAFAQTPAPAGTGMHAPARHATAEHTKKIVHHKAHQTGATKHAGVAHAEQHAMTKDTGKGTRAAPGQTAGARTDTRQAQ